MFILLITHLVVLVELGSWRYGSNPGPITLQTWIHGAREVLDEDYTFHMNDSSANI